MSDLVNLSDLRAKARRRADMEGSKFVTDDEVDGYLNDSYKELYDLLISNYGNDYFLKSQSISIVSGTDNYDLPTDFYKGRGLDLQINSSLSVPLQSYNFSERTRNTNFYRFAREFKYRLQAYKVYLTPSPTANYTAILWYIPTPRKLQKSTATSVVSGASTVYTVPPLSFVVGDVLNNVDFIPTGYNTQQKITAKTTTTVTTDLNSSTLGPVTSFGKLESTFDAFSGWDEYVIVDVAIKLLQKEESDASLLMSQKGYLIKRIEAMSQNLDAGEPMTVKDISVYEHFYLY